MSIKSTRIVSADYKKKEIIITQIIQKLILNVSLNHADVFEIKKPTILNNSSCKLRLSADCFGGHLYFLYRDSVTRWVGDVS